MSVAKKIVLIWLAVSSTNMRIHDSVVGHFCPFTMALSLVNYFFWNLEVRLFC